ncbi:MAG: FAD-dependent oxidoreductase [Robiginitomaculum sp.]|nr:MAG: FAD-dependent oxidoreductase [Robiginitomaculum sp.]
MTDLLTVNDRQGEYPASYYAKTGHLLARFPPMRGDKTCDVCVVGAGYTGLSTALHLAERGYSVILLEAQRVAFGASGRNGGQVGSGQRVEQDELEKMVGLPHARELWEMGEESKSLLKSLIKDHAIDCGYKDGVMHAELRSKNLHHTIDYVEKLQRDYGYDQIEFLDREAVQEAVGTQAYCGGSMDWGAGHLHPLNYALGLAKACTDAGVQIFENSRVDKIERGDPAKVHTPDGQVTAQFVALGANGYLGNLEPKIASRVMPINNFIVATEPLGADAAKALIRDNVGIADSKFVVNYFRLSEDNRLLFGGGESYGYKFPKDLAGKARKPMLEIFPQLEDVKIDYAWGGTLGITMNRMPDFRRLTPNILSASGFSGHGVAMGTLAGKLMAEAISGTAERFDIMAKVPTMRFPGGATMRLPILVLAMIWFGLRDRL